MGLSQAIAQDIIQALKNGQPEKVSALRLLQASIQNEVIARQKPLTDEQVIILIQRLVKQRQEAERYYRQAGRLESAQKEADEVKLLENYLPPQLTETELTVLIHETSQSLADPSMADFGQLMKIVMAKVKGQAPASKVARLVKQQLSQ